MKMRWKLLLCMLLLISLAACATKEKGQEKTEPSKAPTESAGEEDAPVTMSVAVLKGPTAMGMVRLMELQEKKETSNEYQFTIAGTADEITAKLIKGEIPIAAIPCNLASVLYHKSEGKVVIAAVNTLGVLYLVEQGETVQSVADLKGKTIYATGQGTTPEYTLRYLLQSAGIDPDQDVTIEYLSEASEVAARLAAGAVGDAVAMLPQPYVTTVMMKNPDIRIAIDVTKEWAALNPESTVVTGVLAINKAFLEANEAAVNRFLTEYAESTRYAIEQVEDTAALLEHFEIFPKAVAQKALPMCNLVNLQGPDMRLAVEGYLTVLHAQNPASVGGALPGDDFYYYPAR